MPCEAKWPIRRVSLFLWLTMMAIGHHQGRECLTHYAVVRKKSSLTSMLEASPSLPPLLRKSRPPGEIATRDTAIAI